MVKKTLASIDIGTVTTRLMIARLTGFDVECIERLSIITNLGEGVDATGCLSEEAIERTCKTVEDYRSRILAVEASGMPVDGIVTTATSAARDALNASEFLTRLEALGLKPLIIGGSTEAHVGFLGVAGDFLNNRITVADIGGGSTELTCGLCTSQHELRIEASDSLTMGARRICERFFKNEDGSATPAQEHEARAYVAAQVNGYKAELKNELPHTLVCVGGTATSLVSMINQLIVYDRDFVHLYRTTYDEVHELTGQLLHMTTQERAQLVGLQPQRAPIIAAGALILDELMACGGWSSYIASEADSFYGLLCCAYAVSTGTQSPLSWEPQLSSIHALSMK
ncbi:MAG: phosphatase [Coriobacteriales bacterium]|nr:phosphatase [Coriobacteriales bacterium]